MWKKIRNSILLGSIFLSLPVVGQVDYDLPSLIDLVLSENYQVRILRNDEIINRNNNTLGAAGFLPQVNASGSRSNTVNNTVQRFFNGDVREGNNAKSTGLNGLVRVDWAVFDGFGMFARQDQFSILEDIGRSETKFYLEQTISDVASLYYQLISTRLRQASYEKTLSVSRFRYGLEKKKLEVGSTNALVFNQAEIDYNTDSILVIEQARIIKNLEIRINRLIGADPEQTITTSESDIVFSNIDEKNQLIEWAVLNNQELQKASFNELLAEINSKIQKADLYPQVDVFGQYAYNRNTSEVGFTELNRSYGAQYGVSVRFNLFNGKKEQRELVNSKIYSENTSIQKADIRRSLESAIVDIYHQYHSIKKQLDIALKNVNSAEKSQFIASEQLEKQAISGYDFRLTQLSVINTYNTVTQLKLNLKLLEIEIYRLTGKLSEQYL